MISSSSGMLPAWVFVVGVALCGGYIVGFLRGFAEGQTAEKREAELAAAAKKKFSRFAGRQNDSAYLGTRHD